MILSQQPLLRHHPRRGYVLIAVLIVIVVLSLAAYRYADMATAEYRATDRILLSTQSKSLADSGIHYAGALVSDPAAMTGTLAGNPFDNSGLFRGKAVELGNGRRGYFDVVSVDYSQDPGGGSLPMKYGVTDESGRINLNALLQIDSSGTVALNMLKKLPNMTDDIANSIIDWIDTNEDVRSGGAETSYYEALGTPYRCKNGPLDSVEELLLVKGVTPELLFGNDLNRNGKLDGDEPTSGGYTPGWAPYLTVFSRERNVDNTGAPRININGRNLRTIYGQLKEIVSPELAAYIVAYRYLSAPTATAKVTPGTSEGLVQVVEKAVSSGQNMKSQRNISSIYQLFGTSVASTVTTESKGGGKGQPMSTSTTTAFSFPIKDPESAAEQLGLLLDKTTIVSDTELSARINVMTASPAVLAALPGLEQADVDGIIAARPAPGTSDPEDPTYQTSAWMYTEAKVPAAKMQALDRYVTGRTQVYRIQAVGYFEREGPIARIEAVVDANNGKPRFVYYRDLTELGRAIDPRQQ